MSPVSRREFIKAASSSAVAGAILSTSGRMLYANPLGMPLGCQTWPVRDLVAKDFRGTLKMIAAAGFHRDRRKAAAPQRPALPGPSKIRL